MTRTYTKAKRAENQAETRQRIVEAAMELHEEVGPAATTISMIAERAGVQRHTVYSHFADEMSLLMACSGLHLERHPVPSPADWEAAGDHAARLAAALTALYAWFGSTERMIANVLRDAEHNAVLHDIAELRFGAPLAAMFASLSGGLAAKGKAALGLAISFYTWRTLVREIGMKPKDAVALMVGAVLGRA